ncbi:hypothetical protein B0T09DRAFT_144845 [Sordaria sp. MPI-SDFR-AT-0083]|nr:hypothetical protein B0T09DRAFT_144845 [Sordaria sp. MPI-SDFR-AT-0083]
MRVSMHLFWNAIVAVVVVDCIKERFKVYRFLGRKTLDVESPNDDMFQLIHGQIIACRSIAKAKPPNDAVNRPSDTEEDWKQRAPTEKIISQTLSRSVSDEEWSPLTIPGAEKKEHRETTVSPR